MRSSTARLLVVAAITTTAAAALAVGLLMDPAMFPLFWPFLLISGLMSPFLPMLAVRHLVPGATFVAFPVAALVSSWATLARTLLLVWVVPGALAAMLLVSERADGLRVLMGLVAGPFSPPLVGWGDAGLAVLLAYAIGLVVAYVLRYAEWKQTGT